MPETISLLTRTPEFPKFEPAPSPAVDRLCDTGRTRPAGDAAEHASGPLDVLSPEPIGLNPIRRSMRMKDVSELKFPEELGYVESHEWVRSEDGRARIGITDYAQDQLGDVVYVELPAVGKALAKGAPFGSVESVKAVSELYMPVSGKVVETNPALENSPELVNSDPYGQGWMIVVEPSQSEELKGLLGVQVYREKLKG
jgi:glycine cleavage system H protein